MSYELHRFSTETERKFSMEQVTISPITKKYEAPSGLEAFDWPFELQGKAETDREQKHMYVRYPEGDALLSFITTIHELGHLGQTILVPSLQSGAQSHELLLAQEQDAWTRGWQRMLTTRPDVLKMLDKQLIAVRRRNPNAPSSIEELYAWIEKNILALVEAQKTLFEPEISETVSESKWTKLKHELEKTDVRNFFSAYADLRCGETVNRAKIETFIADIVANIIIELNEAA